jgi:hypothetical protein
LDSLNGCSTFFLILKELNHIHVSMSKSKTMYQKLIVALLALSLFSCKKEDTAEPPVVVNLPSLLEQSVSPATTDAAINTFTDNHYVYFKRDITALNKLCVFLPGSGAKPENYKLFVQKAGSMGYHAFGLMYPNPSGIYNNGTCETSPDNDCFYKLRLETMRGTDESTLIDVNAANSIINRVKKLIQYLQTQYPTDNWGQYVQSNGDLAWGKIVFAGHSQGAGHSVFMTKFYPIARAVMLSNKDFNTATNLPAAWYALPNVSAANNVVAFTHSNDEYADQQIVWNNLGLASFGAIVNTDGASIPYSNTRRLTSLVPPAQLSGSVVGAHASVAADAYTPKDANGKPVFDKVWEYMLTF